MASPADRRYKDTHEWHKPEGDIVIVGLSRHAVRELTDITFVDVKKKTGPIHAGESFGEIESVKATSELYSGIDGEIIAVNQDVLDNPALINEEPFERGWILHIRPANPVQLDELLCAADYDKSVGK